jgi:5-methylcytosine-specific restriction endonuclease McrA
VTKRRSVKEGFWVVVVFVALLVFALLADWWKEHAAIGWAVVGVLLAVLAFLLYRFASLRGWLRRQVKTVAEKAVFEEVASEREPLPPGTRKEVLERARDRCENESCSQDARPHIHHIDGNNSNNRLANLIALCPNCHQRAHNGLFTESQLHNWVRRDWQRLKSKRAALR